MILLEVVKNKKVLSGNMMMNMSMTKMFVPNTNMGRLASFRVFFTFIVLVQVKNLVND